MPAAKFLRSATPAPPPCHPCLELAARRLPILLQTRPEPKKMTPKTLLEGISDARIELPLFKIRRFGPNLELPYGPRDFEINDNAALSQHFKKTGNGLLRHCGPVLREFGRIAKPPPDQPDSMVRILLHGKSAKMLTLGWCTAQAGALPPRCFGRDLPPRVSEGKTSSLSYWSCPRPPSILVRFSALA